MDQDLVLANHILADHGVVDAFGHVSVRHAERPDRFLLSRSMAPSLVTREDILEFDLDGNPLGGAGKKLYLERFIHSEIYRAQKDVLAIVHSHSAAVIPFGLVASVPLRAVSHLGSFLGDAVPVFEIRNEVGSHSDMLISDRKLGAALARSFHVAPVTLMRGHGMTVVGNSLQQAVFRAVYTQLNARLQAEARLLGPINYLTAEEAMAATASNDGQIERTWNLWKRRVAPCCE
jgi:ribulose-5-phosphate 4-epimerase/fuculose-1-phosphate aldolase